MVGERTALTTDAGLAGLQPAASLAEDARKRLLHVGCGPKSAHRLHAAFRDATVWNEIRLDVDPRVAPDIVCSTADMRRLVLSTSVDAIWSSHTIEHLDDHDVGQALREFRRVLRPQGHVLIRCPDFQAVVEAIQADGLETVAYVSPAGPITPLDMIFGHRASIARGNGFMAHRTAFTAARLGRLLVEAGFAAALTRRAPSFDLWALAVVDAASLDPVAADLAGHGLVFSR
jgi:predicted SAM-dependent methyltransferase